MSQDPVVYHCIPVRRDLPDLEHAPGSVLCRAYYEEGCVLCASGECWQREAFRSATGNCVIVHGLPPRC